MLVESMATSLVVGKLRGGKIKNIGNINIRGWYLFIAGFTLEFASVYFKSNQVGIVTQFLDKYFILIHSLSYILLLIGLILNFNKKSMVLIFIGTLLNFIVIASNGGHMPVSGDGLSNLGLLRELEMLQQNSVITHTLVTQSTRLTILGDVIPIPKPHPLPKMISIGDIFIALGIFLFIQGAMINENMFKRDSKMVKFKYKGL